MRAPAEGRVALVTGAASGIGRATAMRLADDGFEVALVDVDAAGLDRVASELTAKGRSVEAIPCDLRDLEAVGALFERIGARHDALSAVACCAGIVGGASIDLADAGWDEVMDVNLRGTFAVASSSIPLLERAGGTGSLVLVASISGLVGSPYGTAYSASKGGVVLLARSLARRVGPLGVRVNCVCPGPVDTPMLDASLSRDGAEHAPSRRQAVIASVPLGRVADPAEIAAVVSFLVGPDASFVNGAVIPVDGGMVA